MTATLADHPDWRYLLREFDALYRHQSAGGSAVIRTHQRDVPVPHRPCAIWK